MKKISFAAMGLAAATQLVGCSAFTPPTTMHTVTDGTTTAFSAEASRSVSVVRWKGGVPYYCSVQPADVANTTDASLKGGLTAGNVTITNGEAALVLGAIALAGRDPAVVISRDVGLRLCEASLQGDFSTAEGRAIWIKYLDIIGAVAKAEADKAKSVAQTAATQLQLLREGGSPALQYAPDAPAPAVAPRKPAPKGGAGKPAPAKAPAAAAAADPAAPADAASK